MLAAALPRGRSGWAAVLPGPARYLLREVLALVVVLHLVLQQLVVVLVRHHGDQVQRDFKLVVLVGAVVPLDQLDRPP